MGGFEARLAVADDILDCTYLQFMNVLGDLRWRDISRSQATAACQQNEKGKGPQ